MEDQERTIYDQRLNLPQADMTDKTVAPHACIEESESSKAFSAKMTACNISLWICPESCQSIIEPASLETALP